MIALPIALAASALTGLISLGVGLYLERYRAQLTEMLGMMMGMTLGMMTGLAAGTWLGLATDMFVSNTAGIVIGLTFGAGFGRYGGLMGVMEGGMGGVMGGMMGAMLGVMVAVSPLAAWVTGGLMALLHLASLVGLVRLVQSRTARRLPIDPVCHMDVDPEKTPLSTLYRGQRVYFCAPSCKRAFEKEPERYPLITRPADQAAGLTPKNKPGI